MKELGMTEAKGKCFFFFFLGGMQTDTMVENELRVLHLDRQAAGSE